jgi:hypothetical protein
LLAIALERVDDASTPPGDMSGIVLAPETTAGVTSSRRVIPKRTDDASTLAKDLLGVTLVPEMTVCSAPDVTSPPSIDQEVSSVFHPIPFRFSFGPPSDPTTVSAFVKAYPNLPGYHMWSAWDRLTAVSTFGPAGSEEEDDLDSGWNFSGLNDPDAMQDFMFACDHSLSGCSDDGHASTTRVMAQVVNVSTSIKEITTKATTSVCRRLTIPLGPHLALTSRGR